MVRVITQETFDEVVKENMEDFDMSLEDAITEATAQFQAQGVDLSNIIKDLSLGTGDHQVIMIINNLREICIHENHDDKLMLNELANLQVECNKDIAHRVKAGKEGAYDILINLLERRQKKYIERPNDNDKKVIVCILKTFVSLMDVQPDLLGHKGVDIIVSILDKIDDDDILIATLKWANVCCVKHELNRQRIFAKSITNNLKNIIKLRTNAKVISEVMQLTRKFTLDDDIRVEFGKAHEHARELGSKLLEPLTKYLKENADSAVVSETVSTMAALLVRHELCSLAADAGASNALLNALSQHYDNAALVTNATKLITALAGNDDVKRNLMKAGIAPVIVALLNRHGSNAVAGAMLLKCISALTLREPDHSVQFFDNDAPEAIVNCLKIHPDNAAVQKNGCWAVRNMVARCREQNHKFHELGVECLLKDAYKKFEKDFGFDIKSALRDLECDVKLDEQWTGKGVQMEN
ncbi:unnamed protein product [Diatraea saccharalis]|uniref:Armadillo repeat-containing protein 6 homolog n=1 Tax=Diatraea saccharalis TaxID=40085 RepID=A0A9N9WHT7_9NEOP|nr:unnamed protein product [Diatraea saccharalis]